MLRHRDLREQLAFKSGRDERRIRPGVLEKLVVIPLPMSHPCPAAVEGDSGDYDQVKFLRAALLLGQQAQLRLRLENLVYANRQLIHVREEEQIQLPLVISP